MSQHPVKQAVKMLSASGSLRFSLGIKKQEGAELHAPSETYKLACKEPAVLAAVSRHSQEEPLQASVASAETLLPGHT